MKYQYLSFTSDLMCPTLSDPENGVVTILDDIPGGVAIYRCNPGLALVGDSNRTCGIDEQWSGEPPTCRGA